jgi:hypothetical protein
MLSEAIALACLAAVPARAVEAKPLGIATFKVQATLTREVLRSPGAPGSGFVNEPYAFTQAGGHPEALTSVVEFKSEEVGTGGAIVPTRDPKDMAIDLPPGLLANPQAVPRCPPAQAVGGGDCPSYTQVGEFAIHVLGNEVEVGPIVNVVPPAAQSAELGLEPPVGATLLLTGRLVRTTRGYALAVVGNDLPGVEVVSIEMTLWGVPADASHDSQRNLSCEGLADQEWTCKGGGVASGYPPTPFLTLSSDCSMSSNTASVWADSWQEQGRYVQAQSALPGVTGCELLHFGPTVALKADTLLADAPVGLGVSITEAGTQNPQALATPPLRAAIVTLPEGVSLSPSVADGVRACSENGAEGIDMPTGANTNGEPLKQGELGEGEEIGLNGEPWLAPGHCPEASKVGAVEATTPLSPRPLKGNIYLAQPRCGGHGQPPCSEKDAADGELYRLFLELYGQGEFGEGMSIKLEGRVEVNPATGRLTVKLSEGPQLPLSLLKLELDGGSRALLDNPATCGPATMTADLVPWGTSGTTPEGMLVPGVPDVAPFSSYEVMGCADSSVLNPGFLAGTLSPSAGAFSGLSLSVTRNDREQYLRGVQVRMPPGLLGMLASVPLCEEALANAGKCPPASRIGSTTVASGAGSHPFEMPGSVYLTAGYRGSPFGLSIVTPAIAGPFNLGLVVIRARVDIDPRTAALTITSDALPQIVLGIPLRLRRVTLNIDRPGFIFNPTSCVAQQITATVTGVQGANANVVSPFAVGGCKGLAFKPILKASASGRVSATDGASLDVKLAFPKTAQGTEANIARIKLALPHQLASRLTTLQHACDDSIFDANPAVCPKASIVGIARASTPVLPAQLAGPVYFVSHGGRAFPSLVVVLQGDGMRFDLTGATAIDSKGITSATFGRVPDVPVSSFELYLPQGPHSALGATTSLCAPARVVTVRRRVTRRIHGHTKQRTITVHKRVPGALPMPTELVAQNGLVIHHNTKLEVSDCRASKAHSTRRARTPKFKVPSFL